MKTLQSPFGCLYLIPGPQLQGTLPLSFGLNLSPPPPPLDEAAAAVADGSRKERRSVGGSELGPKSVSRPLAKPRDRAPAAVPAQDPESVRKAKGRRMELRIYSVVSKLRSLTLLSLLVSRSGPVGNPHGSVLGPQASLQLGA